MPVDNSAENGRHCVVVKLINGDGVEVAKKARRDGIATAAWWPPREQHMQTVTRAKTKRVTKSTTNTYSEQKATFASGTG